MMKSTTSVFIWLAKIPFASRGAERLIHAISDDLMNILINIGWFFLQISVRLACGGIIEWDEQKCGFPYMPSG